MVTVYADTSVIGGCFDEEFEEFSVKLMEEFRMGSKRLVVSDLVLSELQDARAEIQSQLENIPTDFKIEIKRNNSAIKLADEYIKAGAISKKYHADALHIALATVNKISILASWNFKHIVNVNRIKLYNTINLRMGYDAIEIQTPREILMQYKHEKTKKI